MLKTTLVCGALLACVGTMAYFEQGRSRTEALSELPVCRAMAAPAASSVAPPPEESSSVLIARALGAGPESIRARAQVAIMEKNGDLKVLRPGDNGWTCMPGVSNMSDNPPQCANAEAIQWYKDIKSRKPKPTITSVGIVYMLDGAVQRSDSDPFDKTSPPIRIGPHWMIMWPFDPKSTGLPATHRAAGAYIMWAGSPWAHVHVMGAPEGNGPGSIGASEGR